MNDGINVPCSNVNAYFMTNHLNSFTQTEFKLIFITVYYRHTHARRKIITYFDMKTSKDKKNWDEMNGIMEWWVIKMPYLVQGQVKPSHYRNHLAHDYHVKIGI